MTTPVNWYYDPDEWDLSSVPLRTVSTHYYVGDVVRINSADKVFFQCATEGTTSASSYAPSLLVDSWTTFSDGSVVWKLVSGSLWIYASTTLSYLMYASATQDSGGYRRNHGTPPLNVLVRHDKTYTPGVSVLYWGGYYYNLTEVVYGTAPHQNMSPIVGRPGTRNYIISVDIADGDNPTNFTKGAVFNVQAATDVVILMSGHVTMVGVILNLVQCSLTTKFSGSISNTRPYMSLEFISCEIRMISSGTPHYLILGIRTSGRGMYSVHTRLQDTEVYFYHQWDYIAFEDVFQMEGGKIATVGVTVNLPFSFDLERRDNSLINFQYQGTGYSSGFGGCSVVKMVGVDLTGLAGSWGLFSLGTRNADIILRGCLLPPGVSVVYNHDQVYCEFQLILEDCGQGSSVELGSYEQYGKGYHLKKVYDVGSGEVDQYGREFSLRVITLRPLKTYFNFTKVFELTLNLPSVGVYDLSLEILSNSVLFNTDIWLEILTPGESDCQGQITRTVRLVPFETPVQLESSEISSWSGVPVGFSRYKIRKDVYLGSVGKALAKVFMSKPDTEVYLRPSLTVEAFYG